MKKLAIISTHPIQYNAPLFKTLAERQNIEIKVFYTWSQSENGFYDNEFNKKIHWDIPLLDGYNYEFIKNISKKPNSKHFFGIICPELINKIEALHPDAILVYGWAFQAHFKVLKYFKGKIPVLFRGDSTLTDKTFGIKRIFRTLFLKYVYRFVDYAFFVGTHNKMYFIKAGLKNKQLIYLPYAVDKTFFEDSETKQYQKKANEIRKTLGIKPTDKVIAFIGKYIKKKSPVFLLKAVQKYNSDRETKVKLLFIGSGKQELLLKKIAANDENIFFLPFVNQKEMPVAYRIADIFVLPSKGPNETWGVSVNEALACERLVLVSNKVGSAIDLVRNNKNGAVFASNSYKNFIIKLNTTLNKNSFVTKKNTNSFSIEELSVTIENLINKL